MTYKKSSTTNGATNQMDRIKHRALIVVFGPIFIVGSLIVAPICAAVDRFADLVSRLPEALADEWNAF